MYMICNMYINIHALIYHYTYVILTMHIISYNNPQVDSIIFPFYRCIN